MTHQTICNNSTTTFRPHKGCQSRETEGRRKDTKGAYKRVLQVKSISESWGEEQKKAFLMLKVAVTSAPVLKTPQYDGRIFRVVMDGSKKGLKASYRKSL